MIDYPIKSFRPVEPVLDPPQESINPERTNCPAKSIELHRLGVWCVCKKTGDGHLIPFENIKEIVFDLSKKTVTPKVTPLKAA